MDSNALELSARLEMNDSVRFWIDDDRNIVKLEVIDTAAKAAGLTPGVKRSGKTGRKAARPEPTRTSIAAAAQEIASTEHEIPAGRGLVRAAMRRDPANVSMADVAAVLTDTELDRTFAAPRGQRAATARSIIANDSGPCVKCGKRRGLAAGCQCPVATPQKAKRGKRA